MNKVMEVILDVFIFFYEKISQSQKARRREDEDEDKQTKIKRATFLCAQKVSKEKVTCSLV